MSSIDDTDTEVHYAALVGNAIAALRKQHGDAGVANAFRMSHATTLQDYTKDPLKFPGAKGPGDSPPPFGGPIGGGRLG